MKRLFRRLQVIATFAATFGLSHVNQAAAQGVIPIALQQVMNANGQPMIGALLYIYQAGTVATPQNVFSDPGLTLPLPNPLSADATGRLPMFYLASGSVHVRLTDPTGVVIFDYPSMLVIGASGGSSSGGSVDPTTIASTGDIKFRATGESLVGWVKMNGLTIGSASSGATGRANADTQNLFVYLWNNCTNVHCPVAGGRGTAALSDFNANKQMTLPDWRARMPVGLDDMGNTPAGILQALNVTSAGDGVTTPGATGGQAVHIQTVAEMATHNHTITDPGHSHTITYAPVTGSSGNGAQLNEGGSTAQTNVATTGITINSAGSSTPFNVMSSFMLGTWFMKL
jgi:hypothetical protein